MCHACLSSLSTRETSGVVYIGGGNQRCLRFGAHLVEKAKDGSLLAICEFQCSLYAIKSDDSTYKKLFQQEVTFSQPVFCPYQYIDLGEKTEVT